ncbi:MFS transporter [Microlunatus parietis]|uniref:MFS family permease n=1 Tax=Microlunatus parietis TaxID=682979 RepID=A0A7Y9I8C5_9ACTN|nr:MFS transporter [Microlunatus parietis]NYE71856.1 MFS family permease [Microlunatus parietis]
MTNSRGRLRGIWGFAALGGLAQSLAGAAGGLLARELGGTELMAGLPATMLTLGAAGMAVVLSRITRRRGRLPALRLGSILAAVGCAAVVVGGLPGVMIGSLLVGSGNAAVMLARYAAADLRPAVARARSIASVMVMITVGAVVGPNLLAPSAAIGVLIGASGLAGGYVVAGVIFVVAAVALGRTGSRPAGSDLTAVRPAGRLSASARSAVVVLAVSNLVMVGVMTMAPLHLEHGGTGLAGIGLVVSLHIAGMFAPAVVSGRITERLGARPAVLVALALLVGAGAWAALAGADPVPLGGAMIMLGIGWNLATVAGSDLLTADVPPLERPQREGLGELGMGLAAALGGVGSGVVMHLTSYPTLAWLGAGLPALLLAALFIWKPSTEEIDHVRTDDPGPAPSAVRGAGANQGTGAPCASPEPGA